MEPLPSAAFRHARDERTERQEIYDEELFERVVVAAGSINHAVRARRRALRHASALALRFARVGCAQAAAQQRCGGGWRG